MGSLRTHLFEAASTFALGGALFLASNSSTVVFARPAQPVTPFPALNAIPGQHRGPVQRPPVRKDPQPFVPISAPIVSAPAVPAPVVPAAPVVPVAPAPAPVMPATPPVNRMEPLRINSSDREQIIASHADAMRREHCLRKLEARQRELRQRSSH